MKKRVAVLISGGGTNLQALINAAKDPSYPASLSLVISNQAAAGGLQRAEQAGIPTQIIAHIDFQDRASYDAELHQALLGAQIDLVCLAGFMRLLTADFVQKWEGRMINIHPSLLPSFKGLNTHQQALDAGVKLAGCTVHFVVPEMDAGPIIAQASVPVLDDDTERTLRARVLEQEHKLYPEALAALAQDRLIITQNRVTTQS